MREMIRRSDVLLFLRGFARKNLGLKILALALAVLLWWFVAGETKVLVGFAVPLEIRNVPAGMTVTNKVERQVEVRLAGPPSLLGSLQQAEVTAAIDLSEARAGRQVVRIEERSIRVPPGVKVQRIYPNAVEVSLERLERRRLPVVARIGDSAEPRRKVARIKIAPPFLEVEALPEEFSRMKSLLVYVPAPAADKDVVTVHAHVELTEGHAKIIGKPDVRVTIYFRK